VLEVDETEEVEQEVEDEEEEEEKEKEVDEVTGLTATDLIGEAGEGRTDAPLAAVVIVAATDDPAEDGLPCTALLSEV